MRTQANVKPDLPGKEDQTHNHDHGHRDYRADATGGAGSDPAGDRPFKNPVSMCRKPRPRLIPWIETTLSKESIPDAALFEGLDLWSDHADQAIVTVVPGGGHVYEGIRAENLGIRVISGLKTASMLRGRRFDSLGFWVEVAREVHETLKTFATTAGVFVLEHETALRESGFYDADPPLDLKLFAKGLALLPEGIRWIWYPGIGGGTLETLARSLDMMAVVNAKVKALFVHHCISGPKQLANPWHRGNLEAMEARGWARWPILYFYGPGSGWWEDDQLHEALSHVTEGTAIVYPGGERWPLAACKLTRQLERAAE